MFDDEFNGLIDLAIADGVVDDREKSVLYNKARQKGYDLAEVDAVLQAKLNQQQTPPPPPPAKNVASTDAVVKCPSCHEIIPPLTGVCPACGYVLANITGAAGTDTNLNRLVSEIEETLAKIKSMPAPTFFGTFLQKAHIVVPAYFVILLFLVIKSALYMYAGFVFAWLSIFVVIRYFVYRNPKAGFDGQPVSYDALKADFERYTDKANRYFGENKKVKQLLQDLSSQLAVIEQKRQQIHRSVLTAWTITGAVMVVIWIIPFVFKTQTLDEKVQADKKAVLNKLDKKTYQFTGDTVYVQGNLGENYHVFPGGINISPGISDKYDGNKDVFLLTVSPVKFSLAPKAKRKLKKELKNLLTGCTDTTHALQACADIQAYLSFEGASGEMIKGLDKFVLLNTKELGDFLQSGSNSFSASFLKDGVSKEEMEQITGAKQITVNILGVKK